MGDEGTNKVDAFLTALGDAMERHQGFWRHGELGVFPSQQRLGTVAEMRGDVDLESLSADHLGRGWATAAMGVVGALADLHGVNIYLVANSENEGDEDDETLDQGSLERFYARCGFRFVGSSWGSTTHMRRAPLELTAERRREIEAILAQEPVWEGAPAANEHGGPPVAPGS